MTLSALIITLNEQHNIGACLESLMWADEIVVVDAESTDETVAIARKYTDKVYVNPWQGYSNQRNYGAGKCTQVWILAIDADERITPELRQEIRQAISQNGPVAYRIRFRDFMFGKWIYHVGKDDQNHVRLYRAGAGGWASDVHESLQISGPIASLSNPILHYSHLTIHRFVEKANRYTELEAQGKFEQGIRINLWQAVIASIRVFGWYYISRRGFRDGGHGFVRASLLAIYHFFVRIKLWELWYKHDHGVE